MSTIKDNLVQIREKLDTEKTQPSGGGVLEEVKKIRQVLDTGNVYPDGGGLAEELTMIRELVEEGKGGGSGGGGDARPDFDIQKVRVFNDSGFDVYFHDAISIDSEKDSSYPSKYGYFGAIKVSSSETKEFLLASIPRSYQPSKEMFIVNTQGFIVIYAPTSSDIAFSLVCTNYPSNPSRQFKNVAFPAINVGSGSRRYNLFIPPANTRSALPDILEITIQTEES